MKILFVNNARYDLVGVQTAVNKLADLIRYCDNLQSSEKQIHYCRGA